MAARSPPPARPASCATHGRGVWAPPSAPPPPRAEAEGQATRCSSHFPVPVSSLVHGSTKSGAHGQRDRRSGGGGGITREPRASGLAGVSWDKKGRKGIPDRGNRKRKEKHRKARKAGEGCRPCGLREAQSRSHRARSPPGWQPEVAQLAQSGCRGGTSSVGRKGRPEEEMGSGGGELLPASPPSQSPGRGRGRLRGRCSQQARCHGDQAAAPSSSGEMGLPAHLSQDRDESGKGRASVWGAGQPLHPKLTALR